MTEKKKRAAARPAVRRAAAKPRRPAARTPAAPRPAPEPEPEPAPAPAGAPPEPQAAPPAAGGAEPPRTHFTVDLAGGMEQGLHRLREEARHLVKKGRHTRVRIRFRGREIATVPLALLVAAEAASFWWAGLLRVLLVNVVGKALLEVEIVNEADGVVAAGKARLLDGDLDKALEKFREALEMDRDHAGAHLNLGVALKLKGRRDEAKGAFEKALELDPEGDTGREARRQLENLRGAAGA